MDLSEKLDKSLRETIGAIATIKDGLRLIEVERSDDVRLVLSSMSVAATGGLAIIDRASLKFSQSKAVRRINLVKIEGRISASPVLQACLVNATRRSLLEGGATGEPVNAGRAAVITGIGVGAAAQTSADTSTLGASAKMPAGQIGSVSFSIDTSKTKLAFAYLGIMRYLARGKFGDENPETVSLQTIGQGFDPSKIEIVSRVPVVGVFTEVSL